MAIKGQSLVNLSKKSQDPPKVKMFRDPVSGKVLPQNPQGNASPVGSELNKPKPGDSKA